LGGRARSRHQLSTLLNEAYENREALEERIAEGRRNRKEAGNKYGEPLGRNLSLLLKYVQDSSFYFAGVYID
jgi:hypothetical protein